MSTVVLGLTSALLIFASYNVGVLVTRRQDELEARERYEQGYSAGHRTGWYDAADEAWKMADRFRNEYLSPDGRSVEYINGHEDAAEHLDTFWDELDKKQ